MNIFVLDEDPKVAATYHCDKHVVKMILETAQMLSTVHRHFQTSQSLEVYKSVHVNHPATRWAGSTAGNYAWLLALGTELCHEYTYRYEKRHKTQDLLTGPLLMIPEALRQERTSFVQCIPERYKCGDAVTAYRQYYLGEKLHFARWSKRSSPYWVTHIFSETLPC